MLSFARGLWQDPEALVRYRLRHQGSEVEVPRGEFVIGRSSGSSLSIDDALVSRRHAVIHVDDSSATIEDCGSRNGVGVNGERIEGRRKLAHLDRIHIGGHELLFLEVQVEAGRRTDPRSPTLAGATIEFPVVRNESLRPRVHLNSDELTGGALLTGMADKVMALGRFEEAERLLGRWLNDVLAHAKAQRHLDDARVKEATAYALRLAEGTRRTVWLDWVFELHEALRLLLGAEEIERVHELVRKLRYANVVGVRRCLDAVRANSLSLSPADKFLLQRLEGIERIVSA